MPTGIIFPTLSFATRGTVLTHLEVAKRGRNIFVNFDVFLYEDLGHGWPGRSPPLAETSGNRENQFQQTAQLCSEYLTDYLFMVFPFLTCMPSLISNKNKGRII